MNRATVITFGGYKGGDGKSTCAINTAVYCASKNLNVCILDADQQGSCNDWIDLREELRELKPDLPKISLYNKHSKILVALKDLVKQYDVIVVDTPCANSDSNVAVLKDALFYSDLFYCVCTPSQFSLNTLNKVCGYIHEIQGSRERMESDKLVARILLNKVKSNKKMLGTVEALGDIEEFMQLCKTRIKLLEPLDDTGSTGLGGCEMKQGYVRAQFQLFGQEMFDDLNVFQEVVA